MPLLHPAQVGTQLFGTKRRDEGVTGGEQQVQETAQTMEVKSPIALLQLVRLFQAHN